MPTATCSSATSTDPQDPHPVTVLLRDACDTDIDAIMAWLAYKAGKR